MATTSLKTRRCPGCGAKQVLLQSTNGGRKMPMQWGCADCGRIDETEAALTRREVQIVELICQGKAAKEIAVMLEIELKTAETHRANIYSKLKLHSVAQLVLWAVRNRVVDGYLLETSIQNGDAEKQTDFHRAT